MKKRYIVPIVGAAATLGIAYVMKGKDGRNVTTFSDVLENAGKPDQSTDYERDQLENAKMVSEGSQFGVQYYNEIAEEHLDESK